MTTANTRVAQILLKRGNTTQSGSYVGPLGEVTMDTGLSTLRLHDGTTPGGFSVLATKSDITTLTNAVDNLSIGSIDTAPIIANVQAALAGTINANLTAANTAIARINANLGTATTNITTLFANAVTQEAHITSLIASVTTVSTGISTMIANAAAQEVHINLINANITAANSAISLLQSNAAIQQAILDTLTGNAATQASELNILMSNAASQAVSLTTLISNAAGQQNSLTSLLANAATQAQQIAGLHATGDFVFASNEASVSNGLYVSNKIENGASTAFLSIPAYGDTANPAILYNNYGNVDILVGSDGVITNGYQFSNIGLQFADGTTQPTAYTGDVTGKSVVIVGDEAEGPVGSLWYSTVDGRLYVDVSNNGTTTWVDASPAVVPANMVGYDTDGNLSIETAIVSPLLIGTGGRNDSKWLTVSDMVDSPTSAGANGILVAMQDGGGIYMTSGDGVNAKYEAYEGSLGVGTMSNHPVHIYALDKDWEFRTDGQLVLPQSTHGGISAGYVTSAGNIGFNADGNLWNFGADGTMSSPYNVKIVHTGVEFPDSTIQTTAYPGNIVVIGNTVTGGIGSLYYDTTDGRMYVNVLQSGQVIAVDANPAVVPANMVGYDLDGNITLNDGAYITYANGQSILEGITSNSGSGNVFVTGAQFLNGDSGTTYASPQMEFGWANTDTYKHWIHTRHYGSSAHPEYNAFDFYTCDGTQFGTFPSNGTLALTIAGDSISTPGSLTATGGIYFSDGSHQTSATGGFTGSIGGNQLTFDQTRVGQPAEAGANDKITLYPEGSSWGYGIGIESSYTWLNTGQGGNGFKFYNQGSLIYQLDGSGITFPSGDKQTAPFTGTATYLGASTVTGGYDSGSNTGYITLGPRGLIQTSDYDLRLTTSGTYGAMDISLQPSGNVTITSGNLVFPDGSAQNTAINVSVVNTAIDTAINNLIDSAPGTLNTLNEIAANLAAEAGAIGSITSSLTTINNNITTLQGQVYGDSNVASYLSTHSGEVSGITVVNQFQLLSSPPSVLTGAPGDKAGDIAFDDNYLYRCTADYVDQHYSATSNTLYTMDAVWHINKGSYPTPQVGWTLTGQTYPATGDHSTTITGVTDEGSTWGITGFGIGNNGVIASQAVTFYNPTYPVIWTKTPLAAYSNANVISYLTTNTVTAANLVISGGAPATLVGGVGDLAGMIRTDNNYLYRCTTDYSPSSYTVGWGGAAGTTAFIEKGSYPTPQIGWTIAQGGYQFDITNVQTYSGNTNIWQLTINSAFGSPTGGTAILANPNPATIWTKTPLAATVYSNANVASYLVANPQSGTYSNANVASYLVANPQAGTYSNTNVSAYLSGNVTTGNIQIGTALQIHGLDNSISTVNGSAINVNNRINLNGIGVGLSLNAAGDIQTAGNVNASVGKVTAANVITTNGVFWANGVSALTSSYGNTQVAAYLLANPQAGTYSNSNVASYLTTATINTTGNITAGNVIAGANLILTSNSIVYGDFSNSTVNYRTIFQTSTVNGTTGIYAVPNGTSTGAAWQATNNSNLTNASKIMITTNGTTDVQLVSGINGAGTYLPLSFLTNGTTQMQLGTNGNLTMVNGGNISTTGNVVASNVIITNTYTVANIQTTGTYGNITGANVISANSVSVTTFVRTLPVTFATLPSAGSAGAGARAFITDGNVATFGSAVSGGGLYYVPVFSNGTSWWVG